METVHSDEYDWPDDKKRLLRSGCMLWMAISLLVAVALFLIADWLF